MDSKSQNPQSTGHLNGEWELEHDFMCSSCGEIFDELREVWHHKWDAHPLCLVMHVTLPRIENTYLPPHNLIYPQLGRQLAIEYGAVTHKNVKAKTIKKRKGRRVNADIRDGTMGPSPQSDVNLSYQCKKCVNQKLPEDPDGKNVFQFDTKEKFYVHLLECGGDLDWEGKRDKKKKGSKKNVHQSSQPKGNCPYIFLNVTFTNNFFDTKIIIYRCFNIPCSNIVDLDVILKRRLLDKERTKKRSEMFNNAPMLKSGRKTRLQIYLVKEERNKKRKETLERKKNEAAAIKESKRQNLSHKTTKAKIQYEESPATRRSLRGTRPWTVLNLRNKIRQDLENISYDNHNEVSTQSISKESEATESLNVHKENSVASLSFEID